MPLFKEGRVSKILVTSALPYANGPIHLGHLVEYLLTDFYVRFMRSCGEDVVYVCADDTHGTPIEIKAQQMGIKPEELVGRIGEEHRRDFAEFGVAFDHYDSTNSPENKHYAELIFERLRSQGHIVKKPLELTFCEHDKRFLPDRYVRGICPKCGAADQYGDVCEKCGATYAPTDLKEPRCSICGTPPVRRSSDHYFFKLGDFTGYLKEWSAGEGTLDPSIRNNLLGGWLGTGLADWCISRDGPYFGFTIPGETDKYFYVWLDAPIGYISSTERMLKARGAQGTDLALAYWDEKSDARILHVIGKDILNFHALFWPAVLKGAQLKRPDKLLVHGMLTVNGEKMSKSRGTFITARQYLEVLDPSYLRYFYAANLGPSPEDIDLSLKEFRLKVNAELVNNLGNLCNRALSILATKLGGKLSSDRNAALLDDALKTVPIVRAAYSRVEMRNAIRAIVELGERTNKFVQDTKPWEKVTSAPEEARRDLSTIADIAYLVATMLSPVVPKVAEEIVSQLNARLLTFKDLEKATGALLPPDHQIGAPKPIIGRLDEKVVEKMVVAGPPAEAKPAAAAGATAGEPSKKKAEVAPVVAAVPGVATYDDFAKIELRVAKVLTAERVPKADRLLKLTVDVGEPTPRTVAAGEPKTGMVLVEVPGELPPGTRIK
ncbi:MAG: methionine--tRNA ligase [Deltaproteobacteria bacterium]|nr:methionine--tRNA ligase [Deltaproteobacteria bacterium]